MTLSDKIQERVEYNVTCDEYIDGDDYIDVDDLKKSLIELEKLYNDEPLLTLEEMLIKVFGNALMGENDG